MADLSDVVFRQHKEIQALEVQLKNIRERLEGSAIEDARSSAEERPPHY